MIELSNEKENVVCPYENLVDYNIFHIKKDHHGNNYVPVKYDLDNLIDEHVQGQNPLSI